MPPPKPARQINLMRGWPAPSLHPAELLRKAADKVLRQTYNKQPSNNPVLAQLSSDDVATPPPTVTAHSRPLDYNSLALAEQAMLYGPDPGHLPLRKAIGKWLWDFYGPAIRRAYPKSVEQFSLAASKNSERDAARSDGSPISFDRITITGGASQSMDVILSAVTDPTYTRKVWVVAPAYYLAFKIFRDAGFAVKGRMVGIPEHTYGDVRGRKGPDVKWLREKMEECEREWRNNGQAAEPQLKPRSLYPKIYKHIIYTVPSFANPSSITTSIDVREELVQCARDFDALVICDDVYDMLQWPAPSADGASNPLLKDGAGAGATDTVALRSKDNHSMDSAPLPRLVDVDRFLDRSGDSETPNQPEYGNVVSNASFSKICGPGCRNGWIEATPALAFLISQEGGQKSGGAPGQLVSTFLCDMLERGELQRHVRDVLRPAYEARWKTLVGAITEFLVPLGVTMPAPHGSRRSFLDATNSEGGNEEMGIETERAGGYFVWLTLPDGVSERRISQRCLDEENLIVAGGKLFQVPEDESEGNTFDRSVRLCFAWEAEEELEEGVKRLGRVLRRELEDIEMGVELLPEGGGLGDDSPHRTFLGFG